MENGDDWLAMDKLEHIIFCFIISIIASTLATRTRYPFIRNRSIWVGSIISFSAGAGKEFADEMGFFMSAGASTKDAVADFIGIFLAAVLLHWFSVFKKRPDFSTQTRVMEMV